MRILLQEQWQPLNEISKLIHNAIAKLFYDDEREFRIRNGNWIERQELENEDNFER